MKIFKIILKVILLILTAIWGMFFGIMAPLSIMFGDVVDVTISSNPIIIVWLINSIVFYTGGTFVTMLEHTKIASIMTCIGMIGTFVIYGVMENLYKSSESSSPTTMYMPCIFITITTLVIMLITNLPKWLEKKHIEENQKAPSILG